MTREEKLDFIIGLVHLLDGKSKSQMYLQFENELKQLSLNEIQFNAVIDQLIVDKKILINGSRIYEHPLRTFYQVNIALKDEEKRQKKKTRKTNLAIAVAGLILSIGSFILGANDQGINQKVKGQKATIDSLKKILKTNTIDTDTKDTVPAHQTITVDTTLQ